MSSPAPLAVTVPIGIVAGSGDLPRMVMEDCQRQGRSIFVIALDGETDPKAVEGMPHAWIGVEKIGAGMKILAKQNIHDLVMVGRVARPELLSLKPDFTAIRLLTRLLKARLSGDDAVLTTVTGFLEEKGFRIHGVQDVVRDITAPQGVIGTLTPDARAQNDIALGVEVARHIGQYDIGQAVVVQGGRVLGIEAAEGTDRLIERVGGLQSRGPGAVLIKVCKPSQDVRIDLPALGPETARNAARAGLRGIAMEAGKAVLIRREEMVAEADRLGLFLYGVKG